ncbi:MAG TPA: hypothetical protein VGO61_01045 [Steroidobacteraceae bacterium]|nr:hypothetical protein [Steroidobacteraceae bacterium]
MKTFATTLFCAALAMVATVAQAADNPRSVALVRAMRSDEIAVATTKLAFLSGSMGERYGKTSASCIKHISYVDFTAGWARVVDNVLTPQEVETSLAFFQSDAGVKYVEGLMRRLRARQGESSLLPEVPGKEDITPAQLARISEFSSTGLGRKVMGKDLSLSPASVAMGRETGERIAAACGK